ncbi:MAG: FAD-dependent oxidoreductase [Chloroflexota bacterium]
MTAKAWQCSVCGYIHRRDEPPDWCPICGSPREVFEPFVEPVPVVAARPTTWQCLVCGHVAEGATPPDACPVCGATTENFEPAGAVSARTGASETAGRVVVVGAGIAGVAAVDALRGAAPGTAITLLAREFHLPYYRLNLTRYLAGEIADKDLPIYPAEWYVNQHIDLRLGAEASSLDLEKRHVVLREGEAVPFDKVIVTAGAHPFVPPIPGANRAGVTALRTIDDARHILELARPGARCVCIGGGILGLETAGALARRGVRVTLLEGFGWLLPRQLNRAGAAALERRLDGIGLGVRTNVKVAEIAGAEDVSGVRLEDGEAVPADIVVVAAGIRPNTYLARAAGLHVNQGIVVDDFLASSHPDVLAAGDAAEHRGVVYGIWPAAKYQGSIAGLNAAGVVTQFGGIPRSNTLKVLGVDLFSIGQIEATDGSFVALEEEVQGNFWRFVFRDGVLTGAILIGDTSLTAAVKQAVEAKTEFSVLLARAPRARDAAQHLGALPR